MYYEFSLRGEVYSLPPGFRRGTVIADSAALVFDRRPDGDSVRAMIAWPGTKKAKVDGNILTVTFENRPPESFDIGGVRGGPSADSR